MPQVLVLNDCGIDQAGAPEDLKKKCNTVKELDLAQNKLENWNEVSTTPGVVYKAVSLFNSSFNNEIFSCLRKLYIFSECSHFCVAAMYTRISRSSRFSLLPSDNDPIHEPLHGAYK